VPVAIRKPSVKTTAANIKRRRGRPTTSDEMNHMYVSPNLRTIYASVVTGSYFWGFPGPKQWGKQEISASKLGLQKKAID